jgi:hypothetical protein
VACLLRQTRMERLSGNAVLPGPPQQEHRDRWALQPLRVRRPGDGLSPKDTLAMESMILGRLLDERPLRRVLIEAVRDLVREPEPEVALSVEARSAG